jgi:hypothetical protein
MINFEFDIDTKGMLEAEIDVIAGQSLDMVAEAARDKWIELAKASDLKITKREYIDSIGEVEAPSATERKIDLEGWLANALEEGVGSFDMKPGLLKGREHRAIPFLYGKPGSKTKTNLSTQTFNKVKDLKRGERFSTKLGRSKYEGLQRAKSSSGKDSFVLFRTVSVNSPSDSWIHPGLTPLMLSQQVAQYIDSNMSKILGD